MIDARIGFFAKLKHILGFHSWGDVQNDFADWVKYEDGEVARWRVCRICHKTKIINTRY